MDFTIGSGCGGDDWRSWQHEWPDVAASFVGSYAVPNCLDAMQTDGLGQLYGSTELIV
jgi:hypothetical protein